GAGGGGGAPGREDGGHGAARAAAGGPAAAVVAVLAALVVLGAAEVGQDVLVAPAVEAHRPPLVVVGPVAADVDHRVQRARPAEDAAARQVVAAVGPARLGLPEQGPIPHTRQLRAQRGPHSTPHRHTPPTPPHHP